MRLKAIVHLKGFQIVYQPHFEVFLIGNIKPLFCTPGVCFHCPIFDRNIFVGIHVQIR